MGESRYVCIILARKPLEKHLLERPKKRLDVDINMDFRI
jgi:hypothetical protein